MNDVMKNLGRKEMLHQHNSLETGPYSAHLERNDMLPRQNPLVLRAGTPDYNSHMLWDRAPYFINKSVCFAVQVPLRRHYYEVK